MKRQPSPRRSTSRAEALARVGALMATVALSACGGGGGGYGTPSPPQSPPPAPTPFAMVAGAASCGVIGCEADASGGGDGAGSGGDGGDGGGGGLGAMRNVKVTALTPDGSTVLASANLADNLVSIYPHDYGQGAFILVFADDGSGQGQYFDEATQTWTSLGGTVLHAMIPSLTHHVSANPLTEAAYQRAISLYGTTLDAAKMASANAEVLAAVNARLPTGYQVTDITNYVQSVSDTTVPGTLVDTNAGRYGTVLAGFALNAKSQTSSLTAPALAFMDQLASDIVDDGTMNDSAAVDSSVQAYGPDVSNTLANAIDQSRTQFASPSQPPAPSAPNVCFNPQMYVTPGTTWHLNFQDPSTSVASTEDLSVIGTTSFQSYGSAMKVSGTESSTEIGDSTISLYYNPDISQGVESYGIEVLNADGSAGTFVYTTTAVDHRFTMQVGESETLDLVQQQSFSGPSGSSGPFTYSVTQTITFTGYEDVSVPAGTYTHTCRFDTVTTTTPPQGQPTTSSSASWFTSSGQGVPVQGADTTSGRAVIDSVLTSGSTVNGVAVH